MLNPRMYAYYLPDSGYISWGINFRGTVRKVFVDLIFAQIAAFASMRYCMGIHVRGHA